MILHDLICEVNDACVFGCFFIVKLLFTSIVHTNRLIGKQQLIKSGFVSFSGEVLSEMRYFAISFECLIEACCVAMPGSV